MLYPDVFNKTHRSRAPSNPALGSGIYLNDRAYLACRGPWVLSQGQEREDRRGTVQCLGKQGY